VRIERLVTGGAGVGRLSAGKVVFVPHTAAGELVEAEVDAGATPARGRLLGVLQPSPDRVAAPCPHVIACGGCDWMHLSAQAQQAAHAAIVQSLLSHAMPGCRVPELRVHPAPASLGYRTRARILVRADRRGVRAGYRAPGTHDLVPIGVCMVLDPSIAPVLAALPEVLQGASGEGDVQLACGAQGCPVLSIHWRGDLAPGVWAAIDARVASGAWAGVRVSLEGSKQPADFGDPQACMSGADGAPLRIAAGGFAQPSDAGAALLARRVAELAESALVPARPRHVLELFAGSGTLSILLARGAASFTAVEADADAAACARTNLAARSLGGSVVLADANTFAIPARTEIVIMDPPRAGAPGATRAIAASRAKSVLYVACDPATLARDLGVLGRAGFTPTDVETFELFPQTSHVETAVRLVRGR
jgi:23S rRNA (uracil1939-C5)-methyltransferase